MQEILFRGKRVDNGEWVYGDAIHQIKRDIMFIKPHDYPYEVSPISVDPDTVGQYTGLTDKNGKKIFEGDILRFPAKDRWEQKNFVGYEVFFHDNDCADRHVGWQMNRQHFYGALCGGEYMYSFLPKWTSRMEIIGNTTDNPELL